jgi:hypothetical protein
MKRQEQQQKQIVISAYDMEVIQKSFTSTLKWLEFYIEKSGYSGNWKRQISETIKRKDLNQPSEIKRFMETALLALDGMIENKPDFILENLQEKFYSWLAESGIGIDDCPEELVECLVDIHKVLNNEGKEFGDRVDREASEGIARMTPEERRQKFRQTLNAAQRMMDVAREREKSLEGKTYKDVETKNQFFGDPNQGKKLLGQIENKHSANSGGTNLNEIVQNVIQNPQNWRLDEIATEINNYGETKQEILLIHRDARLSEYSHEGKFNFNNNPVYRWESFNSQQRFEIKQAKKITGEYLTDEEIKWVVREVKENPRIWKTGKIDNQIYLIHGSAQVKREEIGTLLHNQQKFNEAEWVEINGAFERAIVIDEIKQNAKLERLFVLNRETGEVSENEDWFIHNQLKRVFDKETGYLIYVPNLMVRAKDLTEVEQKELNYNKLENTQQVQSQNRSSGGKGGLGNIITWGSFTVISLIGLAFTKNTKK